MPISSERDRQASVAGGWGCVLHVDRKYGRVNRLTSPCQLYLAAGDSQYRNTYFPNRSGNSALILAKTLGANSGKLAEDSRMPLLEIRPK